jgi:hypothetical protein
MEAFYHILPYSAYTCCHVDILRFYNIKLHCPQFTLCTEFTGSKNISTNLSLYHGTTLTGEPPVLNQLNYFEHVLKELLIHQSYAVLVSSSILLYILITHPPTLTLSHSLTRFDRFRPAFHSELDILFRHFLPFRVRSLRKLPSYSISTVGTSSLS